MVGVVMPHGILFRGGSRGHDPQGHRSRLTCSRRVIGLAPNLFSGASIPVAICILNKDKPAGPPRQGAVRRR